MTTGNQHASRKAELIRALHLVRYSLRYAAQSRALGFPDAALHHADDARYALMLYRAKYNTAPASTRRRWSCGH